MNPTPLTLPSPYFSFFPRRALIHLALDVATLLILHAVLLRVLAEHNLVAALFAAGDHLPRPTLALALFFICIRLLTVLALPGLILARLALAAHSAFSPPSGRGVPPRSAPLFPQLER